MDIITGFEPVVVGSSPAEGTLNKLSVNIIINFNLKIMKKIFSTLLLSLILLTPTTILAGYDSACGAGIVPCGCGDPIIGPDGKCTNCCELSDIFVMLNNVYGFMIKYIATTLATIMIIVGAVFMMISAGNPNLAGTGRKMVYSAIIGMILVFGSWLIINSLLELIGYKAPGGVPWYSI